MRRSLVRKRARTPPPLHTHTQLENARAQTREREEGRLQQGQAMQERGRRKEADIEHAAERVCCAKFPSWEGGGMGGRKGERSYVVHGHI